MKARENDEHCRQAGIKYMYKWGLGISMNMHLVILGHPVTF